LLRIARREYLAYVRTPGFWLSLLLLPVGLSTIAIAPLAMSRSSPTPRIAIVDFSGQGLTKVIAHALAAPSSGGPARAVIVPAPTAPFTDPADAGRRLSPTFREIRNYLEAVASTRRPLSGPKARRFQ
jgi:ABC-2 type transport system permease protein